MFIVLPPEKIYNIYVPFGIRYKNLRNHAETKEWRKSEMPHISEYEVEAKFIERIESLGYTFAPLNNYDDVLANFRLQLSKFNAKKLTEAKGEASFSDKEYQRVLNHVENKTVYESAKILRDQYVLTLDNGKTVYLDFFQLRSGQEHLPGFPSDHDGQGP